SSPRSLANRAIEPRAPQSAQPRPSRRQSDLPPPTRPPSRPAGPGSRWPSVRLCAVEREPNRHPLGVQHRRRDPAVDVRVQPGIEAELGEQAPDVVLDRLLAAAKAPGDLTVAPSGGDPVEHA